MYVCIYSLVNGYIYGGYCVTKTVSKPSKIYFLPPLLGVPCIPAQSLIIDSALREIRSGKVKGVRQRDTKVAKVFPARISSTPRLQA